MKHFLKKKKKLEKESTVGTLLGVNDWIGEAVWVTYLWSFDAFKCYSDDVWFLQNWVEHLEMAVTPGLEHTRKAIGWAARDTSGVLSPFNFTRRYSSQTSSIPQLQ